MKNKKVDREHTFDLPKKWRGSIDRNAPDQYAVAHHLWPDDSPADLAAATNPCASKASAPELRRPSPFTMPSQFAL
jgi:hypothetical protein